MIVTGANGFIASATDRVLIEHGFQVVGIVRTAPKGTNLENVSSSLMMKLILALAVVHPSFTLDFITLARSLCLAEKLGRRMAA